MKRKINKRLVEISKDFKQITLPDSRFYSFNDKYYPSITHVLKCYPKGKYFEEWLKKVGSNAEWILEKAAAEGSIVHNMIENYLKGTEIKFLDINGNPNYSIDVWKMFLRFVDFWTTYNPTLLEVEAFLWSEELGIAGTTDIVCVINDELWVIDNKTSNYIYNTHELQVAGYSKMYEECFGKKVDRSGVLWLKSKSRTANSRSGKKLKGVGWELHESARSQEENLNILNCVKTIFDVENPNLLPKNEEFETIIQLKNNEDK